MPSSLPEVLSQFHHSLQGQEYDHRRGRYDIPYASTKLKGFRYLMLMKYAEFMQGLRGEQTRFGGGVLVFVGGAVGEGCGGGMPASTDQGLGRPAVG